MNGEIHKLSRDPNQDQAKIRVLIVEDSAVIRQFLEHMIGSDPRLEVVGAVGSAEEALRVLDPASPRAISPDVISMDIRLPGMNGLEATQRIMSEMPTPIVVVSASVESEDLRITMNALAAGALTVLEKPSGTTSIEYEALALRLCTQLAIMSKVKVVRRHSFNKPLAPAEGGCRDAKTARPIPRPPRFHRSGDWGGYRVLGIVSSTGGPNALVQVLGQLGPDFPLPIVLVQHIIASFLEGFASWLDGACPFSVAIVNEGVRLVPGRVYIPGRDRHLQLMPGYVRRCGPVYAHVDAGAPVSAQRPSGTILFESMANTLGGQGLGVLLTGMGEDGAAGLLRLRERGGYTIAEHESTAVVYGMPAEAVRLRAVCESLPLPAIARRILQLSTVEGEACD